MNLFMHFIVCYTKIYTYMKLKYNIQVSTLILKFLFLLIINSTKTS